MKANLKNIYGNIIELPTVKERERFIDSLNKSFNEGLHSEQEVKLLCKAFEETLEKAGHKYFKREGIPGNYKYYYTEAEYKEAKGKTDSNHDSKKSDKNSEFDSKHGTEKVEGVKIGSSVTYTKTKSGGAKIPYKGEVIEVDNDTKYAKVRNSLGDIDYIPTRELSVKYNEEQYKKEKDNTTKEDYYEKYFKGNTPTQVVRKLFTLPINELEKLKEQQYSIVSVTRDSSQHKVYELISSTLDLKKDLVKLKENKLIISSTLKQEGKHTSNTKRMVEENKAIVDKITKTFTVEELNDLL